MSDKRTIEEIEIDLHEAREALTASVNELAARLAPSALAEDAKNQAKASAKKAKKKVTTLLKEASQGDPKALAIVAGVTLGVAGFVYVKVKRR